MLMLRRRTRCALNALMLIELLGRSYPGEGRAVELVRSRFLREEDPNADGGLSLSLSIGEGAASRFTSKLPLRLLLSETTRDFTPLLPEGRDGISRRDVWGLVLLLVNSVREVLLLPVLP